MAKYSNYHAYKHQFKDTSPKQKRYRDRSYFTPSNEYKILLQKIKDLIPSLLRIDRLSKKYNTILSVTVYSNREFVVSGTMYKIALVDNQDMLQTKSTYDDDGVYQKLDSRWYLEREYNCIIDYIRNFYGENDYIDNVKVFFGEYTKDEYRKESLKRVYRNIDTSNSTSTLLYGRFGNGKSYYWQIFSQSTSNEINYSYRKA